MCVRQIQLKNTLEKIELNTSFELTVSELQCLSRLSDKTLRLLFHIDISYDVP